MIISFLNYFAEKYLSRLHFILDLGCGLGTNSAYLSKLHGKEIVALDIDCHTVRYAQKISNMHSGKKLNFLVADAQRIPSSKNVVDAVLCTEVLEHIHKFDQVIEDVKRLLKRNSFFIISVPISSLCLLSVDWLEKKIMEKITLDSYAGHVHRFNPLEFIAVLQRNKFKAIEEIFWSLLWSLTELYFGKTED